MCSSYTETLNYYLPFYSGSLLLCGAGSGGGGGGGIGGGGCTKGIGAWL